jgi:uncharacterized protein YyaL (SSP411 family)
MVAAADTRSLLAAARRGFLPNSVLACAAEEDAEAAQFIPLLAGRGRIAGRAAAYVCRDNTCGLPVTEPEALRAQLEVA